SHFGSTGPPSCFALRLDGPVSFGLSVRKHIRQPRTAGRGDRRCLPGRRRIHGMAGVPSNSNDRASRPTPAGSTSERMQNRSFKNARILIVDDEEANVGLLRRLLERAGFDKVESTTEPADAARLYVKYRPDLILLDLHMPEMDGLAVMDQLNEIAEASYLPILMLTGDMTPEARQEALARGA